jgi:hypothetical protein
VLAPALAAGVDVDGALGAAAGGSRTPTAMAFTALAPRGAACGTLVVGLASSVCFVFHLLIFFAIYGVSGHAGVLLWVLPSDWSMWGE